VTNDGYGATTITGWGFLIDGTSETLVDADPDPWLPNLPYRLGSQDAVTWQAPVKAIAASLCQANRTNAKLHAFVTLASGVRVIARRPITPSVFPSDGEGEPVLDLRSIDREESSLQILKADD
jgi:hypothetical protein